MQDDNKAMVAAKVIKKLPFLKVPIGETTNNLDCQLLKLPLI